MPVSKAYAVSLLGLSGTIIEIEAEISSNLPSFVLIGLPDASLSEARDRVRAAAFNSNLALPGRRVTVNLSPASVPKRGSVFDLAIALAILSADGRTNSKSVASWLHLGELGLDGSLRAVGGVLPSVLAAKQAGWTRIVVPAANLAEAALIEGVTLLGAETLAEVARFHGAQVAAQELDFVAGGAIPRPKAEPSNLDLADVIGQDDAIDALAIAAAGGHHMLLIGPPGVGKTMLAERLPTILPSLTTEESIETSALRSIVGVIEPNKVPELISMRPFEAPHHSASLSALVGGGALYPRPGLVSLANHGVLFLDEAPEFQRNVLEALRQPLESGEVFINRSAGAARFPARFQLVLAANPCPCGNFAGKGRSCVCASSARLAYLSKLSGPLLDRIDMRLRLQPANPAQVAMANLGATQLGRSSSEVRSRVEDARQRTKDRLEGTPWLTNSRVPGTYLRKQLRLGAGVTRQLDLALEKGSLSMRGYDRCLRMAWSSADLAGRPRATDEDIAKAAILRGGEGATSW
jgi:magnesium chelatase family protein